MRIFSILGVEFGRNANFFDAVKKTGEGKAMYAREHMLDVVSGSTSMLVEALRSWTGRTDGGGCPECNDWERKALISLESEISQIRHRAKEYERHPTEDRKEDLMMSLIVVQDEFLRLCVKREIPCEPQEKPIEFPVKFGDVDMESCTLPFDEVIDAKVLRADPREATDGQNDLDRIFVERAERITRGMTEDEWSSDF